MPAILVVSDANWVLNDVRAALSDARFTIDSIDDPRAVSESISESRPDIVLIDLQVGSMGGMAVTRAIRDQSATSGEDRPSIILLLDRDADGFLAGRSGADGWVRKPFSADSLRTAIDGLLTEAGDPS